MMHLLDLISPKKSVALKIFLFSFICNLSLTHIEFAERGSFFFSNENELWDILLTLNVPTFRYNGFWII